MTAPKPRVESDARARRDRTRRRPAQSRPPRKGAPNANELDARDLYRPCDLAAPFETTSELADLDVAIGQERALAALDLAVGMRGDGYNLFVSV